MKQMKKHPKHDLWVKGRACCTLCTLIMRRRTERTDPSQGVRRETNDTIRSNSDNL